MGRRQAALIDALHKHETAPISGRQKLKGVTTTDLARAVFGQGFSEADRVQTARLLNKLCRERATRKIQIKGAPNGEVRWRLDPWLAALLPG